MSQEPEEMLPQQWVATAGYLQDLTADDQTAGHKEAGTRHPIHQLENARRFQGWKGQQQQE